MLTANYDQLGLRSGDKILDLGCGFGRHAFEAARRGASVVALDAGRDEVEGVAAMFSAMVDAGELSSATLHSAAVQGDALH
jgi:cyclopropane fatty-acyl-phospholipid synthase-like methyltransferase